MRLSLAECGQIELNANEDSAVRKTLMGVIEHRSTQLKGVLSGVLSGKAAMSV